MKKLMAVVLVAAGVVPVATATADQYLRIQCAAGVPCGADIVVRGGDFTIVTPPESPAVVTSPVIQTPRHHPNHTRMHSVPTPTPRQEVAAARPVARRLADDRFLLVVAILLAAAGTLALCALGLLLFFQPALAASEARAVSRAEAAEEHIKTPLTNGIQGIHQSLGEVKADVGAVRAEVQAAKEARAALLRERLAAAKKAAKVQDKAIAKAVAEGKFDTLKALQEENQQLQGTIRELERQLADVK